MKYALLLFCAVVAAAQQMPLPWTRVLDVETPLLSGNDVTIAQNLLNRAALTVPLQCDGTYGDATADAVKQFQAIAFGSGASVTGVLDSDSAQKLLDMYSTDGVVDDGASAGSLGYKYKFHIPVHQNRSIETTGTLFDTNNKVLHTFTVRNHGLRDDDGSYPWPDFGSTPGDYGLNEFSSSGNTPTGVVEVDLNSPEPDPQVYGPWPVNRVVRGLKGNAAFLQPNIRDGILMHTGNWTTEDHGEFDPLTMTMPNSNGCMHIHPSDIERIYKKLVSIGVTVNDNTFSGKDYPYAPQGVAFIVQQD
jgi:hypothetical protein